MKYRDLHQQSLRANQPKVYQQLERAGQLSGYLDGVAEAAKRMHLSLVEQLKKSQPFNPVSWPDQPTWEKYLNQVAKEIVLHDRVLVPDPSTEKARASEPEAPTTESAMPTESAPGASPKSSTPTSASSIS